jgi:cytochrome c oxidase assembly factor CtaG
VLPDIWGNLGSTQLALTPSLLIGGAAALYLWGVRRVNSKDPDARWSPRRTLAFLGAMVLVFVSIELVIGVYDSELYYDHMVQHLLLIMVAAPLIAMGAPLELARRATSGTAHRIVAGALDSRVGAFVLHPLVGFVLYAVTIPVAHLTQFYNYSLVHDQAHDLEHLVFLVVGYLFWRPVVAIEPTRHPLNPWLRLVYLMAAVPVDTFCGLALTSASHELFPFYETFRRPWGPSLLTDLHIGGSIMWVGGDTLMLVAMIPVVAQLVRSEEAKTRELDAALDAERARAAGSAS